MENCRDLKSKLSPYLPRAVFILCVIQPLLDLLSFFADGLGISNAPTMLLRFVILGILILGGWIFTRQRRCYIVTAVILLLLTAGHTLACMASDYGDMVGDWANLVRIYQLPITAICFISFLRADERVYPELKRALCVCLAVIAASELLSLVTGTNPYTYANKRIGLLGWFLNTSSQSAILSLLVPTVTAFVIQRFEHRPLPTFIVTAAAFSLLYFFATRLAYFSLIVTGIGLSLTLILTDRSKKSSIAVLLGLTVIFAALIPVSPMTRNQTLVAENAVKKQEHIDELIQNADTARLTVSVEISDEEFRTIRLTEAYEEYLGGLVGRFGMDRVAELYDYSESASDICDARRMKINYCKLLMQDSPLLSTVFGLELGELSYDGRVYDVENDFHGIYYLCGAVGLCLLAIFLLYFIYRIARALLRNFKQSFTFETAAWGIAFISCLAHSYATAGILRRPNASVYFAIILACIIFLTDRAERNTPRPTKG